MGMTRKVASVMTFGLIDFRSDKERTARYTKKSYKLAKQEAQEKQQQQEQDQQQGQ